MLILFDLLVIERREYAYVKKQCAMEKKRLLGQKKRGWEVDEEETCRGKGEMG